MLPSILRLVPSHVNLSPKENLPLELIKNGVLTLSKTPPLIYIFSAPISIPPIEPAAVTIVPSILKSEPSQDNPLLPEPAK